jgi:hypothetical protein
VNLNPRPNLGNTDISFSEKIRGWPLFAQPRSFKDSLLTLGLFRAYSGVAAGHVAATGITNALGWGSSSHAAPAEQAAPAQNQAMDNGLWSGNATQQSWENPACETDIRNFRRCMDENKGDMSICGWYMDQLVRFCVRVGQDVCFERWIRLLTTPIEGLPGCCQALLSSFPPEMG